MQRVTAFTMTRAEFFINVARFFSASAVITAVIYGNVPAIAFQFAELGMTLWATLCCLAAVLCVIALAVQLSTGRAKWFPKDTRGPVHRLVTGFLVAIELSATALVGWWFLCVAIFTAFFVVAICRSALTNPADKEKSDART